MEQIERNISVKITESLLKRLDNAAYKLERNRNFIVRAALEDYIKKVEEFPKGIQKLMRGAVKETKPTEDENEFLSSFEFDESDFVLDEELH
jgi:predicted DNA-binding protein